MVQQRKLWLAFWFSWPVELDCLPPPMTTSLLRRLSFSALVPVLSPSFFVSVTGSSGMMTGRTASKAGLW